MSAVKFDLKGVAELVGTLEELNSQSALKVGQVAGREGAKLIRDELKASAPVGTEPVRKKRRGIGRLRDNIRIRRRRPQKQHQIRFSVGVGRAFWGLFSELGTARQPAQPWMRPAFDTAAPRVVAAMADLIGTGIIREAKRLRRKARKLGL